MTTSSTSATAIDPDALIRSIGWPSPVSVAQVTGGWDTQIWRVVAPDGRSHALRLYRPGPNAAGVAKREAAALRAAAAGGLPVPAVEAEDVFESRAFLILAWRQGRPMLDVLKTRPWQLWALGLAFGRLQARLHRTAPPAELAAPDRDWIGQVRDSVLVAAVREHAVADAFCHGDFHPGNVLVSRRGISGLIDFPNAAAADRRADLGITRAILLAAPMPPGRMRPVFQTLRRLLALAWQRGYRAEAGSLPLDPLFEAWGAAYWALGLEAALRDGRGWARPEDAAVVRRYIAERKRAAGLG